METLLYLAFGLGIAYLIFRRRLPDFRNKNEVKTFMPTLGRLTYVALAGLWFLMNKHNVLLSESDAQRINIPTYLYLWLPAIILLLYSILPKMIIWSFVIVTLLSGWSLHMLESLNFALANGAKADISCIFMQMTVYVIALLLAIALLYVVGPFIQKRNNDRTAM